MVETTRDTQSLMVQEIEKMNLNNSSKGANSFRKDVFFERMNNLKLSNDISEIIWCSFNQ